jgi:hypothetical protein
MPIQNSAKKNWQRAWGGITAEAPILTGEQNGTRERVKIINNAWPAIPSIEPGYRHTTAASESGVRRTRHTLLASENAPASDASVRRADTT